ncbi:hypothetical protein [Urechidicola vernalis]|uniref:Uncharacterized protein n=1 Tax=Urechidicola vernalis TaxID=3075600 RepID=A0ABU2Y7D7_9FLAO|nr:hypothetical protein [Urechidicola sp. P050]MDT0554101.1 hypothetical protein [Urechidicola sp. P050]
MNKFFRKIRQQLLNEGKTSKYFKYAIGEIILVVIGILIALQINIHNESLKKERHLNGILNTISQDLELDTLTAGIIVTFYEANGKNSLKIINKEITKENFKDCPECLGLTSIYKPLIIQTKGYEMLKDFASQNSKQNDSLLVPITHFYNSYLKIIEDSNKFVKEEVLKNVESYKAYNWFVDWTQGTYNKDMIAFFTESETYRKQVASHNLLAGGNHLLYVKSYKQNATSMLEFIQSNLDEPANE